MSKINRSLSITFTRRSLSKLNNCFESRCLSLIYMFRLGDSFRNSLILLGFSRAYSKFSMVKVLLRKNLQYTPQPVIDSAKLFPSCNVKLLGYVTRTTSRGLKRIQFPNLQI